ncbi:hypothetical protein RQP46_008033 [Phenoliferia psychrophenolica]
MVSPLDGYVQLGCSIALVPPQSRTIAATGLLNAILALACLTFGDAPSILTPSELMWYEQQSDCTSSIDGVFGVSQAMLLATAEVCQLAHDFVSQGPTPDLQATAASVFVGLDEHWLAKIIATPDSLRIQIGDLMFRHYLIAFLLVKVFGHDGRVHPRIQQSIAAIKELLVEAACLTGRLTGVIMPLLFASSYSDTASRETFLNLIDLTKHILGCWDVDATERIVREVWKRRDANQENWTYEDVIRDEPSLRILLV